ncbi:hypothetical protein DDB_G0267434 [Dictyostelium discoideum AX4]|uniref:Uncharacterized protein n=1 Tax=Dictyostelium discoideum TaxID=44689 RepID=Q55FQ8_DICDI|nr:hypothetical protein DDB_G0267434 [Dictyostelium discoideum AX4]EAL73169.1 hypothetical protein DDB_G0267434 [Dictyostelium discoideum AX4]|eukprot:XP_647475.1 hypothetical protein DDB_G0267434 [Dictyostelium discoideum AX4]
MEDLLNLFNRKINFETTLNSNNNNYNNKSKKKNNSNQLKNHFIQLIDKISNSLNSNNNDFNNNFKSLQIVELFNLVKLLPFKEEKKLENNNNNNNNYNNYNDDQDYDDDDYYDNLILYNTIRKETIELIFRILPNILKRQSFQYDSSLMTTIFSVSDQPISLKLLIAIHTTNLINDYILFENSQFNIFIPYIHDIFHYIILSLKENNLKIKIEILNLLELIINNLKNNNNNNNNNLESYLNNLINLLIENIIIKNNNDDDNNIELYNQILDNNNEFYIIREKSGLILKLLSKNYFNKIIENLNLISNNNNNNNNIYIKEGILECFNKINKFENEELLKILFEIYFINQNNNSKIEWIYFSTIINNLSIIYNNENNQNNNNQYFEIIYKKLNELILIDNEIIKISIFNLIKSNYKLLSTDLFIKLISLTLPKLNNKIQFKSFIELSKLIIPNLNFKSFKIIIELLTLQFNYSNNNNNNKYLYLELFSIIIKNLDSENFKNFYSKLPFELFDLILLKLDSLINLYQDFLEIKFIEPIIVSLEFLNESLENLVIINNIDSIYYYNIINIIIKCLEIIKPNEIILKSLILLSNLFNLNWSSISTMVPIFELTQLDKILKLIYKFLIYDKRLLIIKNSFIVLNNLLNSNYSKLVQPYLNELILEISLNCYYLNNNYNNNNNQNNQNFKNLQLKEIISITFSKLLLNIDQYTIENFKCFSNLIDNSWCSFILNDNQSILLILDIIWNDPSLISFNSNQTFNLKTTLLKSINNNHNNINLNNFNNNNNNSLIILLKLKLKEIKTNSPIILEKLKKFLNSDLLFLFS